MCGILGLINFNSDYIDYQTLMQMNQIQAHRGPDDEGIWHDKNVGIGHRRLSIIDLSNLAKQPMLDESKRYVLTYNGEIYNFLSLKKELINLGYSFNSSSDTEVVLKSLIEWGSGALSKFNGMYALGFWDNHERKLLLARDRYGIKPLYYFQNSEIFTFSSEQKSILALPNFRKKLDEAAIIEYFTFQNILTNKTFFDGLVILEPGHYLELNFDKKRPYLKKTQYWDYNFQSDIISLSENEYVEELSRLFSNSVKRQLVSDVEVGTYLSGGIDSGSIAAVAASNIENLKSFTCGFDLSSASGIELTFDEREKAEAMSAILKTEHYEMVLKAGDIEKCIKDLVWHMEEPRVGQSYPNYYISGLASKFIKVILSGAGGDELFGGYPWRYFFPENYDNYEDYINNYYNYWQRLVRNQTLIEMFSKSSIDVRDVNTFGIFKNILNKNSVHSDSKSDFINNSLYFESKTFLHGLLVVEDKLSMSHGLETRLPFLDNDLVDFAMRCPVELKLGSLKRPQPLNENTYGRKKKEYFSKTNQGKVILRKMAMNYVPRDLMKDNKQGFSAPDSSWFKGKSIEFVKQSIMSKNSKIYSLLDYETTTNLINQHLNGKENKRLLIWSLLYFEEWLNQYA